MELPFVLQPISEPRRLDFFAIVKRLVGAELDWPELGADAAPSAVTPGADNQIVLVILRVLLLQRLVDFHRTIIILLIPPSGDVQIRHGGFLEDQVHYLRFPERVVIWMVDEIVPGRLFAVKILFVKCGKWALRKIPVEGVVLIEIELELNFSRLHA